MKTFVALLIFFVTSVAFASNWQPIQTHDKALQVVIEVDSLSKTQAKTTATIERLVVGTDAQMMRAVVWEEECTNQSGHVYLYTRHDILAVVYLFKSGDPTPGTAIAAYLCAHAYNTNW